MMNKRSGKVTPSSFLFYTVVILLFAVLLSVGAVAGNWARYRSQDTGGDSARVIRFGELALTTTGGDTPLTPGCDSMWQASVSFGGSEAQAYVFVRIELGNAWTCDQKTLKALGGGVSMSIEDGWSVLESEEGEIVVYRSLAPSEALENSTVIANGGKLSVSASVNAGELSAFSMTVSAKAFAVQGNGFADAAAAWSSVSGKGGT